MFLEQIAFTFSVIGVFVTGLFILSLILKRNDIADVAWGTGIFTVALVSYFSGTQSELSLILTVLAGLWGMRLTLRIFLRNRKKTEDFRYKKWRDEWGKWFYIRSYFQVYLLQGFLMVAVGYSFVHVSIFGNTGVLSLVSVIGLLVWLVGYFFETVGDWQLDRFIMSKPPPGEILSSGLWKYTRHPNYFGEVTMWWGVWIMIASLPMGYIALVSPLIITYLILKVSGIPMLEKSFADNQNFQEYKKRTSAFFPLPPKT
ncbi:MAG: steroid 5-alpha reductase family enzyme [Acidimicrobiales bacterium]|jgi:steroid 5-alpha reductase family enzyme